MAASTSASKGGGEGNNSKCGIKSNIVYVYTVDKLAIASGTIHIIASVILGGNHH
jgi:hypothetical protein